MKLRIYMTLFLGLVVGGIYQGIGNDASKALFNFGFCYTVIIAFMYCPLMPVLLQCKSRSIRNHTMTHACQTQGVSLRFPCSPIRSSVAETWALQSMVSHRPLLHGNDCGQNADANRACARVHFHSIRGIWSTAGTASRGNVLLDFNSNCADVREYGRTDCIASQSDCKCCQRAASLLN